MIEKQDRSSNGARVSYITTKHLILPLLALCLVLFTIFSLAGPTSRSLFDQKVWPACLDEQGNRVDWYIAYKFPQLRDQGYPLNTGFAYAYISSKYEETLNEMWSQIRKSPMDDVDWLNERGWEFAIHGKKFYLDHEIFEFLRILKTSSNVESDNEERINRFAKFLITSFHPSNSVLINDTDSVIMRTLAPAYHPNSNEVDKAWYIEMSKPIYIPWRKSTYPINTVLYNDQPPPLSIFPGKRLKIDSGNSPNKWAHSKGVLMMNEQTGFAVWLTHSTPQFPSFLGKQDSSLHFNNNSHHNGQTFMCVSLQLEDSGKQLIDHLNLMSPFVYDYSLSDDMLQKFPELKQLISLRKQASTKQKYAIIHRRMIDPKSRRSFEYHEKIAINESDGLVQSITTTANQELKLFSKDQHFNRDLYSQLIAKTLNSSLLAQTWRQGQGGELPSDCNEPFGRSIENIRTLGLDENAQWSTHHDHSKWAIVKDHNSTNYSFCISDINRMKSQFSRGGGALCIECKSCWIHFSNMIAQVDSCPKE